MLRHEDGIGYIYMVLNTSTLIVVCMTFGIRHAEKWKNGNFLRPQNNLTI